MKETTTTPPDILAKLRNAWERTGGDLAAFGSVSVDLPTDREKRGTATAQAATIEPKRVSEPLPKPSTRCGVHLPPFDAVEWTNNRRPGWVRVTCRRCGRFLGNHPES